MTDKLKEIKKNYLTAVIIALNLFITILSLVLGCLMYRSNSRSILQNMTYVEVTDFISNIEYAIHFGKSLDSFYGMEDRLSDFVSDSERVDAMYVVDIGGRRLFGTDKESIPDEVMNLSSNENLKKDNLFYCTFPIGEVGRIISRSDISEESRKWTGYYIRLGIVALAGFAVSTLLIIVVGHIINDKKKSDMIITLMLAAWIVSISSYVGYRAYTDYMGSIKELGDSVVKTIGTDLKKVENMGIDENYFKDMDDYLSRYSDDIPELEEIGYDSGEISFRISESYMMRVTADYVLQSLLFLAFSMMILAEYKIFMSEMEKGKMEGRRVEQT